MFKTKKWDYGPQFFNILIRWLIKNELFFILENNTFLKPPLLQKELRLVLGEKR